MNPSALLRQLIVLPALAALMAGLHACGAGGGPPPPAAYSSTYQLRQGDTVTLQAALAGGAAPRVRLERVNDSRCRAGAVCVWAGYISFSFTLLADGNSSSFVLSDNMPNGSSSASRNGLHFTLLAYEPRTVPAKAEPAPDYQVSLKVSNINPP
jgi:hypothetical protein